MLQEVEFRSLIHKKESATKFNKGRVSMTSPFQSSSDLLETEENLSMTPIYTQQAQLTD
jgi:hypothetical protein